MSLSREFAAGKRLTASWRRRMASSRRHTHRSALAYARQKFLTIQKLYEIFDPFAVALQMRPQVFSPSSIALSGSCFVRLIRLLMTVFRLGISITGFLTTGVGTG